MNRSIKNILITSLLLCSKLAFSLETGPAFTELIVACDCDVTVQSDGAQGAHFTATRPIRLVKQGRVLILKAYEVKDKHCGSTIHVDPFMVNPDFSGAHHFEFHNNISNDLSLRNNATSNNITNTSPADNDEYRHEWNIKERCLFKLVELKNGENKVQFLNESLLQHDELTLQVNAAGAITLPEESMGFELVKVDLSGTGKIQAAGMCNVTHLIVDISGTGQVSNFYAIQRAELNLSGTGSIDIRTHKECVIVKNTSNPITQIITINGVLQSSLPVEMPIEARQQPTSAVEAEELPFEEVEIVDEGDGLFSVTISGKVYLVEDNDGSKTLADFKLPKDLYIFTRNGIQMMTTSLSPATA